MSRKRARQNQKRSVVQLRYAPTHDADARLSRTIDILLKAAARETALSKESQKVENKQPPCEAPEEDAPTGRGEAVSDE